MSNFLCQHVVADKLIELLSCGRIRKEPDSSVPIEFQSNFPPKKSGTQVDIFNPGEIGTPLVPIPHDDEESNVSSSQVVQNEKNLADWGNKISKLKQNAQSMSRSATMKD